MTDKQIQFHRFAVKYVMHKIERRMNPSFLGTSEFDLEKERGRFEKRWNLQLRDTAVLDDFKLGRTIGVGAFSRVIYAEHKTTKYGYAMKVMPKERIIRMNQVDRVFFEKRILQSLVHPFHVDLRFVFKTNANLCIVMPFVRGGEIYSYLKSKRSFSEYQTQFYAAQIILALQYMHRMNLIYRDLKPENVLLECDGYIKVTDFGFSKRIEKTTSSFVGTPEYMAPEMLIPASRKAGYSFSVDWWSFGVFTYEMAAGRPPFTGSSLLQIFDKIVKNDYSIPDRFSVLLEDLISKLLQSDVKTRIGCSEEGADELKKHKWFANVDWDALLGKKVVPEFVPNCNDPDPTSNFDQFDKTEFNETTEELYKKEFEMF